MIGNAKDFSSLSRGFVFTGTTLSTFELCVKRDNSPCCCRRRIAVASEGPTVLQTKREGGGKEETGRLRQQMGAFMGPSLCSFLSMYRDLLVPLMGSERNACF